MWRLDIIRPIQNASRPDSNDEGSHAHLAIGLLFVLVFLVFSVTARFRVLYKDDWDWVAPLLLHARFRDYVFLAGNEHIIVIPRALMWLDYRLNGLPGPLMWAVGLGCYLFTAATFVEHAWRRADLPPALSRAATGTILSLIFFTYQLQVFLSPAGITIPLAVALAVGAMLAAIRAGRGLERGRLGAWWLFAAAGFAIAGILTSGQGLAAPFALAAIVLTVRGARVMSMSVGLLACAVVVWLYARATGVHGPSPDAHTIAVTTLFGLAFFAGPVSYANVAAGVFLGAVVLAAGIYEGWIVVRSGRTSTDCQLFCLGMSVFVLITAAMTAMARASFGVAQASQSRYALFAMLYISATLVLWTIRMSGSQVGRRRLRLALPVVPVLMMAALPIDLFVGAVWWAKTENARAATLALDVRVPDFDWIRTLHPDPARPYELSRALPVSGPMGSSPAAGDAGWEGLLAGGATPRCQGDIRLQHVEAGRFFRMSGRPAAPAGATIFLQDNAGTIRGRAEPAPIVNTPDPTYGQVIAAVWLALRRGRLHEPEWFGFAQPGTGPPYRAFVMDKSSERWDTREILCTVSVSELQ